MSKGLFCCGGCLLGSHCITFWVYMSSLISFLALDWQEATCLVHEHVNYKFNYDHLIYTSTAYYTRFNVLVNISNVWVPGFACGNSGSDLAENYEVCKKAEICGKELMLPAWSCSKCEECDQLLTGSPQSCSWTYHSAGVGEGPEKWPVGFRPPYPTNGVDFVHVWLKGEVHWDIYKIVAIGISGACIVMLTWCMCTMLLFGRK